jgi:phage terminase small subunit
MKAIPGTGGIIEEPHWRLLLSDDLEVEAAGEYWRLVSNELRDRTLLAPVNSHAVRRLVLAYLMFDRASRDVLENGGVLKPRRGNSKAIARANPSVAIMRNADHDATLLEAELGISPRRREAVGKVANGGQRARAADSYLKPAASR